MWDHRVETKAELLEHIERHCGALMDFIDTLTPAQLIHVKNPDGWAIKDHLTHLTAWEQSVIAFLKGEPRHEGLGIPEAMFLNEHYDVMNAEIFQQRQHQPLDAVLDNWRTAHQQLLAMVHALSDADLQRPYSHFLPDQPGEPDSRRAMDVIYGNTAPHFREHQEWIQAMLETA